MNVRIFQKKAHYVTHFVAHVRVKCFLTVCCNFAKRCNFCWPKEEVVGCII